MYKFENLKRDEAIADYTARKVNSDVTIVTDNADSYKGNSNIMSYNQTIGTNDVKIIKKMAKEIAEKETELSQRKEHINKKIKEVKSISVSTQNEVRSLPHLRK